METSASCFIYYWLLQLHWLYCYLDHLKLHTYFVLLATGPAGPTKPTGPTGPTRTTRSTGLIEHNRTTRPTGPTSTESIKPTKPGPSGPSLLSLLPPQSVKKILKCVTYTYITLPFAFKNYQLNNNMPFLDVTNRKVDKPVKDVEDKLYVDAADVTFLDETNRKVEVDKPVKDDEDNLYVDVDAAAATAVATAPATLAPDAAEDLQKII